ncbi:hypothetical protein HKD37_U058500 [Glycine soja]
MILVATYPSAGGRRVTRGMRVPRKEYARSRHQRLFEENVGKTGKDVIYELLSERFGSCIYARGSKIGEVVAAQLAQASSARPGEQGCFLQKQPPSGGIFWRAQMGLGAICTPIFTKHTPLCCISAYHGCRMTKLGLCLSSGPPPLDDKRVRITIRMTKLGLCLSSGPPPLDDRRVRITIRMTKLGLCLSSGPPPLDDKRVRITIRMTKLGLCLSSGPPPLDDKRVRITIRMTKLGLCLSSGPPPLDDKRVRITVRMTKLGLCLSSGPPPLDDKRVMTKLGLCLSSGPPPLDDKRVRITVRMTKLGLCLSSGPPPLDDKRVRITIRMTKLGLCLSSGPPPLDDKRVRITIRYLRVSWVQNDQTWSLLSPVESPTVATYPSAGGRRVTRGMRVPRKEYARSRHQRLFEENVGKTGKDVIYELLSERFGSCIYARGSKIGEVVAAQLTQASSARPGEQGCFLQKQPPSGGIFWRAQMGLGAICTPIFTKHTPLCLESPTVATYPSAGGRRETRGMREYAQSRHQRLFEENVGKTGKDVIYELLSERFGSSRPGEQGCFLQKQQPSGGIFWRAQVGLVAICTPIFTKYTPFAFFVTETYEFRNNTCFLSVMLQNLMDYIIIPFLTYGTLRNLTYLCNDASI